MTQRRPPARIPLRQRLEAPPNQRNSKFPAAGKVEVTCVDRHIQLNIGNVVLITLIAAGGVLVVVMAARALGKTTIPVANKVGQGYTAALGVAA